MDNLNIRFWKFKYKRTIIGALIISTIIFSYGSEYYSRGSSGYIYSSQKDSLQLLVDSLYDSVVVFRDLTYQQNELRKQMDTLKSINLIIKDSLDSLNNYSLEPICSELNSRKNETKIKNDLKLLYRRIDSFEKDREKNEKELNDSLPMLSEYESKIKKAEKSYLTNKTLINGITENLNGPGYLEVKKAKYRFYVVQLNSDLVRIHNNTKKNGGQSIEDIINQLKKDSSEISMITNGGMYTTSFEAQGLLVVNYKEMQKLDTLSKPNLNFYLKPNGVFYIDSLGFHISTTTEYKAKYFNVKKNPKYATQSGPMLVSDGIKNPNFRLRSTNLNIRSGVGVISASKIIFLISDSPVNFYDFSNVFEDIFNCKNALYLDGAISKMYINEKVTGKPNPDNTGSFGPIISVTKLKK